MIRKHNVDEVLRSLSRKRDVKVTGFVVQILSSNNPRRTNDLGNGSLGKIDFLLNHCDYRREIVTKF